ncbi:MAG TPA: adenylate/guanylate cyclase domain-containing protein [Candidatus Dormibacteraeota bacterium]|nr:adenylate/guanylate cyclase domain-containing protein [Candidatus Dormibacteraeota bacterium]
MQEHPRFDATELAGEAETTLERVARLVEIGAIRPAADGTFDRGDVIRARVVSAFEAEGFSLDQMETALREHAIDLRSTPLFYPDPSPRTGRTYGEFVATLGDRGELVGSILGAMGLTAPAPESPTRGMEEALLATLVKGWSTVDEEYTLRAARIFGDAARRAAEGWVALFAEAISEPVESTYSTLEEVVPRLLEPAAILSPLSPKLLSWLLERHLERTMNDLNIGRIERRLEQRGLIPARSEHPPAVAFVDVSGYTRLTVDRGDEYGARTSVRLGELADAVVRRRGGRVVKLLGDGVLMLFEAPCVAVEAVVELTRSMVKAGLPAAHAGIHAGPVVERDGDVFGSTVNVASRIANHAPAGTILASQPVVLGCPEHEDRFEPLGSVAISGLVDPMMLCRWRPFAR